VTWILASASPRRAQLLAAAGQRFEVDASGVDETPLPGETPLDLAARIARDKALAVARRRRGRWVLAADTIVVVDGVAFGKPRDADEAAAMLERLSGRAHQVATAFALVDPRGRPAFERVVVSEVAFRRIERDEIARYVESREPLDKAGAYAIQGGAAGFVAELRGSLSNVVGLPMEAVEEALRETGLWRGEES
jgi:nucleoside triphosphate pyrophosphatase